MKLKSEHLELHNYGGKFEPLEGKDWQKVLDKGIQVLNGCDLEWQLGSGTLLGMVREKDGYIHHDTDLDLDVIARSPQEARDRLASTVAEFKDAGFSLMRSLTYSDMPMGLAFICDETDIIFDLCFFYDCWGDGDHYHNVYDHGVFIRPGYSVSNVSTFQLNGSTYNIPMDYKRYLCGRFGADWRVPKAAKACGSKDAAQYLILL